MAGIGAEARAGWTHLAHGADIGVCGSGPSLPAAFEQAALALTAIVTDARVAESGAVAIECCAPDPETLFYDWLNALVFEMATRQMLFGRFAVTIAADGEWHLEAQAWGEPIDRARHAPSVEIKGATYTGLSVREDENGLWHAQCIVDV